MHELADVLKNRRMLGMRVGCVGVVEYLCCINTPCGGNM